MAGPDIEQVLREHGPMLLRIAFAYERRAAVREELAQEMALAVWQALPSFRDQGSLRGYVARVAQFVGLDHIRKRPRALETNLDADTLHDAAATPEHHTDAQRQRARLLRAVRALPTGQRECMLLALEGFDHGEIAKSLGVKVNSIDQRLSRARSRLRQTLEDERAQ